jgi:hypothetical protein
MLGIGIYTLGIWWGVVHLFLEESTDGVVYF